MSSNWTVVVHTNGHTGRSLSLSLVVVVVVGDIYTTKRPTICVQWCVSVPLFVLDMLRAFGVLVWWCAVLLCLLLSFCPVFFLFFVQKLDWKNCTKKSSLIARATLGEERDSR